MQKSKSAFEDRKEEFAKVRALVLQIVKSNPGLSVEEISKHFLLRFGFLPRIDNRLREARQFGWVESRVEKDMRLHWYVKET
jgi:hypothetical protein